METPELKTERNDQSNVRDVMLKIPPEIWEMILNFVDSCTDRFNLAVAFGLNISQILERRKTKDIESYGSKSLKIPMLDFIELTKMSKDKDRIKSYVYFWKHYPLLDSTIDIKEIVLCEKNSFVSIRCMNTSGPWAMFNVFTKNDRKQFWGFKMYHLKSGKLMERSYKLDVDKFYLSKSKDCDKNKHAHIQDDRFCWCLGELEHDCLEIISWTTSGGCGAFQLSQRQINGMRSDHVELHSFQAQTDVDEWNRGSEDFIWCDEFKLIFHGPFSLENDFHNKVTRVNNELHFAVDHTRSEERILVCDCSFVKIPNSKHFMAIFYLYDELKEEFQVLFWYHQGKQMIKRKCLPYLIKAWLFHGSILIGVNREGYMYIATMNGRKILPDPKNSHLFHFTSVCFRLNLLILGTRFGCLYVFQVQKVENLLSIRLDRPDQIVEVANESIKEVRFIDSSHRANLLVCTKHKAYCVTL